VTKQLFVAATLLAAAVAALLQVPSAMAADWTQKLPARSPPGRHGQAMAYDSAHGQVVLFGGLGADNNTVLSDTWTWDGSNWTQRSPVNSPPARNFHAMAYDSLHQQIVLFGGSTSSYYSLLSDTWVWDGSNWAQKFPANSPQARFNQAMAYDGAHGQVVLFGGCCRDPLSDTQDTWV
jgi:hypothetical protein